MTEPMENLILMHRSRAAMVARLADVSLPNVECFFFGYVKGAGHTFCSRLPGNPYALERVAQAALGCIDSALCWNSPNGGDRGQHDRRDETEGRAFRTYRGGWTAVAFWDRSGDARPACNTAFLARGDLTFAQLIRAARHTWPQVWARFTFPIVEVDERGRPK